jgi:hypothetical protein
MTTDTLYDIYDFYETPWWQNPWAWAGISLVILLCGIIIWYLYTKKRVLSPGEKALANLAMLTPDEFRHKQEFKHFYFTLTLILKTYLEDRYSWKTLMLTDEELLSWLETEHPTNPCTATVKAMIEHTLLIKFANVDAIKPHALRDKQALIDLITATKPSQ